MTAGQFIVYWLWDQTLGNNLAWLESLITAAFTVWFFRDHIGKHLAAWWNKHHAPHAIEQHLAALRQHEEEKKNG